jgi:hypothetical protein
MTPGLARLRADRRAETIRQLTLADQDRASAEARAAIAAAAKVAIKAADAAALTPAPVTPKPPPASPRVAAGPSDGAKAILAALMDVAGGGEWIAQKAIPHGLTGRAVVGYLGGLSKRKLVELRYDGGAKWSARITPAGAATMAETEAQLPLASHAS